MFCIHLQQQLVLCSSQQFVVCSYQMLLLLSEWKQMQVTLQVIVIVDSKYVYSQNPHQQGQHLLGRKSYPCFWLHAHYFLTLFCHQCIIIQYKADFFFHQNVTTVEFCFHTIIACCLLLAAEWARTGLVTEMLSENTFGQAVFHCGPIQGRNSGRVTRV